MVHEKELLPQRLERRAVAKDRALGSRAEVRRSSGQVRASRNHQCDPVRRPQRLHMAELAARLAAVSDRVSLFSSVAAGRNVGSAACQASPASAPSGGQAAQALGCRAGQPKRQDDRTRGAARLRRGEKRSSAASGMWWLTRSASCGRWSSRRPACKTARAASWRSASSAGTSSSPRSSGPTRRIDPWSLGRSSSGCGSSASFLDPRERFKFSPSGGSSNAPSAGSTAHAAWPNPTNEQLKAIRPLSPLR